MVLQEEMTLIEWALNHPPILPLAFALCVLVGLSPTIYYLIKMIYSPCKYLKSGDEDESKSIRGRN